MPKAALLALLILLSVPAVAGVHLDGVGQLSTAVLESESVDTDERQIGLLVLAPERKSDFSVPTIDVGTTAAIQHDTAAMKLEQYALDERLEQASTDAERRVVILAALAEARNQSVELRARDRALREAYRNGTIDAETLVRGLSVTDARSMALQRYLAAIAARASGTDVPSIEPQIQEIESQLIELQGPVRDRALRSVRGEAVPIRLYVSVSRNGVVLSMLTGNRYVREIYREDRRAGSPKEIPFETVVTRMRALYPMALNESGGWEIQHLGGGGIYRLRFEPAEVTLSAYMHGGTQDVFYEVRERRLSESKGAKTTTASANGTRLVVTRSYRGGPLRVATYDNVSGSPVGSTVIVADDHIETGLDGVGWTLTPDRKQFTVKGIRSSGNVTTLVRPIEPLAINESEQD